MIINSAYDGYRIEYVLKKQFKISDGLITRLKKYDDGVKLNGVHASVVEKVREGDVLTVKIKGTVAKNIVPVNIPFDVLWEDEDILIVNKPGNMPVHPSRAHIDDTLMNAIMYYLNSNETVHIITRLDRETSGIVLVAKNPWIASLLSDEIKNGRMKKEYIAVVNGTPEPLKDTISAPIERKEEGKVLRCVREDGKVAITKYEVVETKDEFSLVKLIPVTGRTHQLRVHLSYIGNAIYGDRMYGAEQVGERTRLHCQKLEFTHPVANEKISVVAPLPDDFNI